MIKVLSELTYTNGDASTYQSHVTIEGSKSEVACELKALINSFVDDTDLEGIYLSVAQSHLEDLKRKLKDLKND